jgi:hypothetical protein
MPDDRGLPEPTEVVYSPAPSWLPVFLALGITLLLFGAYKGWFLVLAGAIAALLALAGWIRLNRTELQRLPRHQRLSTAVIPAAPLRRSSPPGGGPQA